MLRRREPVQHTCQENVGCLLITPEISKDSSVVQLFIHNLTRSIVLRASLSKLITKCNPSFVSSSNRGRTPHAIAEYVDAKVIPNIPQVDRLSNGDRADMLQRTSVTEVFQRAVLPGPMSVRELSKEGSQCAVEVDDDLLNLLLPETSETVQPFEFRIGRCRKRDTDWQHCALACGMHDVLAGIRLSDLG